MADWPEAARTALAQGPAALVTILATEGSAPRGAGARMVVTRETLHGTIGGGTLEYRVTEQARAILALPAGSWRVQDYPLGPLLGQCCGGRVRLLVEHVDPGALAWVAHAAEERVLVSRLTRTGVERHVSQDAVPIGLSARGDLPRAGAIFSEIVGQRRRPVYLF